MQGYLHTGPSHITVDGTLSNPYVLAAVITAMILIATLSFMAVRARSLKSRLLALSAIAVSCVESKWIYQIIAFGFHSLVIRERIATTFMGSPSGWLAPAAAILGAATGVIVTFRGRRRMDSAKAVHLP